VVSREQPWLLPGACFFQVTSPGLFLAALRSLPGETRVLVIFLSRLLLRSVSARATRIAACSGGFAVLVITAEEGVNWPDDVESRVVVTSEGVWIEGSPYSKLFN